MQKLIPVLLPALLGLVAGLSHSVVADHIGAPTGFEEATTQPLFNQPLRD